MQLLVTPWASVTDHVRVITSVFPQPGTKLSLWLAVQPPVTIGVPVADGSVEEPHSTVVSPGHEIVQPCGVPVQFSSFPVLTQPASNVLARRWTLHAPPGPRASNVFALLQAWLAPHL